MKRLVLAIAVMFSSFALGMPHPTLAAGCVNGSGSFTADGTSHSIGNIAVPANDAVTLTATNNSVNASTSVTLNGSTNSSGSSVSISYSSTVATTISGAVEGAGGGTVNYTISDNGNGGGCPGPWFNPGDGRIPGWPGDRITAWCNTKATPPNIDVWGILPDSTGTRLFQFNIADIVNAGPKGLAENIGALGTVFIGGDSFGNYHMAWFGGPAGATGGGDFAKNFNCGSS